MPLIVANTVVNLNNKREVDQSITIKKPDILSQEELVEGQHLIVNGKKKKVSKMSAYLIDMFTTDSD